MKGFDGDDEEESGVIIQDGSNEITINKGND